jgi:hypothetical protein
MVSDVSGTRDRFSTQVSSEVQARARATVRGVGFATNADYTLAQLTEDALQAYCRKLEAKYNDRKPWPTSERRLRPGPRIA